MPFRMNPHSWYEPSYSVAFMSNIWYPASDAVIHGFLMPSSTAGMYSFGMAPPTILLTNSNPLPGGSGSTSIQQCPYCPLPPDCLINLPSAFPLFVIVSLYATCGFPTLASTLNSSSYGQLLFPRCSSPIPSIIV